MVGGGGSEQTLPIDIHTHKLLEWLIDRRHCKREWSAALPGIREKINGAIQDMPEVDEIRDMLTGTHIQYFHCVRIVELLKETEASSRNIFGGYSSRRMKDWQEIVKQYERDGVGVAEGAAILMRNVQYEVPAMKKRIGKAQQLQQESVRKEAEYVSAEREGKEQYRVACARIGIQGVDVALELRELIHQLPGTFTTITHQLRDLDAALDYYNSFITYTTGSDVIRGDAAVLPMLRYLRDNGNVTVYQWRTGNVPTEVIQDTSLNLNIPSIPAPASNGDGDEGIDFGDDIDFGTAGSDNGDGIDFGDDGVVSVEVNNGAFEVVEMSGSGDITSEPQGLTVRDGVARGADADSILHHAATRNRVIDDLRELEAFLSVRVEEARAMLLALTHTTSALTSIKMRHLYMIHTSPRYVERLCEQLRQSRWLGEKAVASQRAVRDRREDARQEQLALEPRLNTLIGNTKHLQRHLEAAISKKYKDRPVNIMGTINMIA